MIIYTNLATRFDNKKTDLQCSAAFPRLVTHVDDSFLAAVTKLYRNAIPENGEVLDLMSSWVSHLPKDRKYKKVVGHGMNTVEVLLPLPKIFICRCSQTADDVLPAASVFGSL